jgi:mercuric ion transport protein
MTDRNDPASTAHDGTKTALAAAGLLAALGVASCCALPVVLGALGIGSTALFGVAVLVGPYQVYVLATAFVCLTGAGLVMWRQRRARACGIAGSCSRPAVDWGSRIAIALALGLIGLTLWIEPPL